MNKNSEINYTVNSDYAPDISPDLDDSSAFTGGEPQSIIKVIGVGGGGGNAVNYMYEQEIPYVNFVLCNTDKQALEKSPVPTKIILGYDITRGLGAGNKPEVGRQCAEASEEELRNLFCDDTQMVFITAGMGGGTGTGAAPIVARIAKEAGMLTIGIVTVPFFFEGEKKILKALDGAKEMKKHVDALLVINNENLIELYEDYSMFNAFKKADDTLANAARSISEIISENCYINVDFHDVRTTLRDSGTAIIATAEGEGEHRVAQAIHNALHSPLLKSHDLKTSKRLLFKIMCSKDEGAVSMKEMSEIRQFTDTLPDSIDVKWGVGDDPKLGKKVKITVLASGFDVTLREDKAGEPKLGSQGSITLGAGSSEDQRAVPEETNSKVEMEKIYGAELMTKQIVDAAKSKYVVLTPREMDDHEITDLLERVPAMDRDIHFNEALRNIRQRLSGAVATNEASDTAKTNPNRSSDTITF